MTGWCAFILAMAVFLGSHFLPRLGGLRGRLIARFGRRAYFAAYGILSLVLLAWVIAAAGQAPYAELWPQAPWTRWVPMAATPLAFVLAACGLGMAAPATLGSSRTRAFDPANPGFAAISRHPLFLALALWAGAHLLPNGDLAHVVLFGLFALFPLAAIPAFDAKARRELGPAAKAAFAAAPVFSLAPLLQPAWWQANGRNLAIRAALGLFLWAGALHLHTAVIGAWPFPS